MPCLQILTTFHFADDGECFEDSTISQPTQLVGYRPANQHVASSIPSQGTCLGCGFGPRLGRVWNATDQCFSLTSMFLSLSFFLLSPLSKIKILKKDSTLRINVLGRQAGKGDLK